MWPAPEFEPGSLAQQPQVDPLRHLTTQLIVTHKIDWIHSAMIKYLYIYISKDPDKKQAQLYVSVYGKGYIKVWKTCFQHEQDMPIGLSFL